MRTHKNSALTIRLSSEQWLRLEQRLIQDHPRSVTLMLSVMRRELGFTVRRHREFDSDFYARETIVLDFFDARQMTWFILRYGELV